MANSFILIDPSLESRENHHLFAASALQRETRRLGHNWVCFANKTFRGQVDGLPAVPHFAVSGYNDIDSDGVQEQMQVISRDNLVIANDLSRLPRSLFRPQNLVHIPAITANMVMAVHRFLATFELEKSPGWALGLMFQPDWRPSGRISEVSRSIFAGTLPTIRDLLPGRIVFTCETDGLADEYAGLLGTRPLVAPIPTLAVRRDDAPAEAAARAKADGVCVMFLGYTKHEKGVHFLADIIAATSGPDVRFVVQIMGHDTALKNATRKALASLPVAPRLIEGPLKHDDLLDEMRAADILLLPYDPQTYRARGSALFTEARSLGIPVVVPAATAIGDAAAAGGFGQTFESFDAEGVVAALRKAIDRVPELRTAARREAAHGDDSHCRYVEMLVGALTQAGSDAT